MHAFRPSRGVVVLVIGLALSWGFGPGAKSTLLALLGIGDARAGEGGDAGGDGGVGNTKQKVRKFSIESFLGMKRDELIELRKANDREDTQVIIQNFPAIETLDLLDAAVFDRPRIKKLLRALSSFPKNTKRREEILTTELKRIDAKVELLKSDVRKTEGLISKEEARIDAERKRQGRGILSGRSVETPRLKSLKQTLSEEEIRLERAKHVRWFISNWLKSPHWGASAKRSR